MNLVRGVALIGVTAVCCGSAPETLNSLAEQSRSRVAIVGLPGGSLSVSVPAKMSPAPSPKAPAPWKFMPKIVQAHPQFGNAGPGFIPTEIHAKTEFIPTHWPTVAILPINAPEAHP